MEPGRGEAGRLSRATALARHRGTALRRGAVVRSRSPQILLVSRPIEGQDRGRARGTDCALEAPRGVTRPGRLATIEGTEAFARTTSSRRLACGTPRRWRDGSLSPRKEVQG